MTMKYLVGGPESEHFMDMALLETGTKVLLGDPEHVDSMVKPEVLSAGIELRHAVHKISGLTKDPTRNEVEKHIAAKALADKVVDKLTKTRTLLTKRSDQLRNESMAAADRDLGPNAERGVLHSEIRGWVREQGRTPEGMQTIRKALAESEDLASVLWHSPRFLLGLAESTHDTLRFEGLEVHRPALSAALGNSLALHETAEKFAKVIRKVPGAFYNPVVAKQSERRVEV